MLRFADGEAEADDTFPSPQLIPPRLKMYSILELSRIESKPLSQRHPMPSNATPNLSSHA
jgi:hypothetical protein